MTCLKDFTNEHTFSLLPKRFTEKIRINPETNCWEWTASVSTKGYGQYFHNKRQCQAHRVAYRLLIGPIPEGLVLDHTCSVRSCVNPVHLEAVTQKENLRRGKTVNAENLSKSTCPKGHTYDRRTSRGRRCKRCDAEKSREYRRQRREAEGKALETPCQQRTHCPKGHEYTEENTYRNKKGRRVCRACTLERAAARRAKLRAKKEASQGLTEPLE